MGSTSPDVVELARVQILVELVELTISAALTIFAARFLTTSDSEPQQVAIRSDR